LIAAQQVIAERERRGASIAVARFAYLDALTAAYALADVGVVRGLLDDIDATPPGLLPPLLRGHALRYRGLLGDDTEQRLKAAAALFDEYSFVPDAALVRLDHAEWLLREGRSDEA